MRMTDNMTLTIITQIVIILLSSSPLPPLRLPLFTISNYTLLLFFIKYNKNIKYIYISDLYIIISCSVVRLFLLFAHFFIPFKFFFVFFDRGLFFMTTLGCNFYDLDFLQLFHSLTAHYPKKPFFLLLPPKGRQ